MGISIFMLHCLIHMLPPCLSNSILQKKFLFQSSVEKRKIECDFTDEYLCGYTSYSTTSITWTPLWLEAVNLPNIEHYPSKNLLVNGLT